MGTPYDELNRAPIVGLLAHSQVLGKTNNSHRLYDIVEKHQADCTEHPREMLDVVCVADTATLSLGKHILIGNDLSEGDIAELENMGVKGAIASMYIIQDEDKRFKDFDVSGTILAGLIYELTHRIAFEDASIRPWADHLSKLGFYGGIGRPLYCSEEALSEPVRQKLWNGGEEEKRWSRWGRNLP